MSNNTPENRDWYLIDAKGKVLGRMATEIANILRGKRKVNFLNHTDCGDYVVVINADQFVLTGHKEDQKRYYKHTGYLGNLKTFIVDDLKKNKPGEVLKNAVYGMIPHNKLSDGFMARLKVYATETHPHQEVKFKTLSDVNLTVLKDK